MPENQSALGFKSADQNPRYFIDFLDAHRSVVGEREVKNLILELLEPRAGRHVLDLGCGTGVVIISIA
jgi:precorrin-6B methylase 2